LPGANQSGKKGLVPANFFSSNPPFLATKYAFFYQGDNAFLLQRVKQPSIPIIPQVNSKLTREEFKQLDTDQLLAYFASNNLKLPPKIIDKIRDEYINGDALTNLTAEDDDEKIYPGKCWISGRNCWQNDGACSFLAILLSS